MANYDLTYEGSVVQRILDTGKSLEDNGYIFVGAATTSTAPGTPTERVAYIGGPGTYNNFGSTTVVPSGSVGVFKYNGSAWVNDVIAVTSDGCVYAGIATPTTNPGTPTSNVFYVAVTAGTYTNFGGLAVTQGINILKYTGSAWSVEQVVGIDDEPTALSDNLVKSGGVYESQLKSFGTFFSLPAMAVRTNGEVNGSVTGITATSYLPITGLSAIIANGLWGVSGSVVPLAYYDANKEFISAVTGVDDVNLNILAENIPSNAKYIRCTTNLLRSGEHDIISGVNISSINEELQKTENEIMGINSKLSDIDAEGLSASLYTGIPVLLRNQNYNATTGKIEPSNGWNILCVSVDSGSLFEIKNPDNRTLATRRWFSSLNPSTDTYISASSTKPSNAKLCLLIMRSYTPQDADYKNVRVIQDSTCIDISKVPDKHNTELATHKLSIRNLTSSDWIKTEGKYIARRNGVIAEYELSSLNHYDVNIESGKVYRISHAGVTSSSYSMCVVAFYNNTDGWFALDENSFVDGSGVSRVDNYVINIPANATKFAVNNQNTLGDPVIEEITIDDDIILSNDLQEAINSITSGNMKVVVSNNTILVRNHLNATEDIITEYRVRENDQYTWIATYLGGITDSDSSLLSHKIQELDDTTGAFANSTEAPWHMWIQHGYCIPYVTVGTQSLTADDIGSTWKDQLNREYTIGKIDGNNIYLLPIILSTGIDGVYTRGWKVPSSPSITQLIHVSGGVHTDSITVSSTHDTQLRPFMVNKKRVLMADGKEVGNGTYYCNDFVISETFDCTDPWTIQTFFPAIVQEEVGAELVQMFYIHGLACRYDTVLNMKKPYKFSWYGANQVRHFATIDALSGYTPYGMMPRVKREFNGAALSLPHDISNLSRGSEFALRREADLYDVDKIPDRYISWMQNGTDKKIGCASGLSLTRGITVDSVRKNNIPLYQSGYEDCISCSSALTNKVYLKGIVKDNYANNVLPASFIGLFSTYFCYFNPNENTGQVYWYKDGNDFVIYAHYQEAHSKLAINLPDEMNGLSIEVVDKTNGVTMLTDIIEGGKLYISTSSDSYNYVVLKTQ